jgi:hypothetical protein
VKPPLMSESASSAKDDTSPFEVDLTGAVETLDDKPLEPVRQAVIPKPDTRARANAVSRPVDVYELSVEPDLRALESELVKPTPSQATPGPAKRDARATAPRVAPPSVESRAIEAPPALPAEPSGDRRKKSAKRPAKGAKAKSSRQQAPQQQVQPQAAQDEWGIFDPKRCGFAALVDELDKVSDEKTEQRRKGSKVRLISYS